ncbi:glycoside hydrolase family 27 protein [Clostridium lacusfryxellense]|uniref:glycoside hydrolase family 27 protein n=1 Tax=Clostridium lacusfryxellense TaxID=205328 RepID=UPI001C0B2FDA|nr:glycoside hydrolase family 27 protein [Clostridium lacusfryxellense]MBU3113297.1 glycoside hydrolase family 27 protein [Clostridium lacusfryxellense]
MKQGIALTPPMGWNSWDCYGASVNEERLIGNADYMALNMKEFGWVYIICDIQWYEPEAKSTEYNNFYPLQMDEYSRLIPAVNRFPSASGGFGFEKIAGYIHGLGLKFGIHIMRGIPRQAVHAASPIKGCTATARDIASSYSICSWNTDMYGVNPDAEGAQEYYNSLFQLYAKWGVDFVKVDDICNTEYKPLEPYSAKREIELIRSAIGNCGRDMVLSLSPGPAVLDEAKHLCDNANMWRITGDFWDNWDQLYAMFERCKDWSPYVKEGCWPDCDMLPLGHIAINTPGHNKFSRYTNFTKDEQITMMTLWCIFRSPLMLGAELRDNDKWTLSIITNPEVLRLLKHSYGAKQIQRTHDTVIWVSSDEDGSKYVAFFNTSFTKTEPAISFMNLGINGTYKAKDLWTHEVIGEFE